MRARDAWPTPEDLDLTDFATAVGSGPCPELEWERPRHVARIVVRVLDDAPRGSGGVGLRVQYWRHTSPTVYPDSLPGTLRGWIPQDDPFHGSWIDGRGLWLTEGSERMFVFDPLDLPELAGFATPDMLGSLGLVRDLDLREGYRARSRKTLKIRVVTDPAISVSDLRAYSGARVGPVTLNAVNLDAATPWRPEILVFNGYLTTTEPATTGDGLGIRTQLLATGAAAGSADATLVTFVDNESEQSGRRRSFTVDVSELCNDPLWIPDLGIYVSSGETYETLASYQARLAVMPRSSIYARVEVEPEQTDERARREIPPLDIAAHPPRGRYIVLSGEGHPFKFALRYNGEVFADKALLKLKNRDTRAIGWAGQSLQLRIGSGDPPDFRERNDATRQSLERGYLPIVHGEWDDRGIAYDTETFVAPTDGAPRTFLESPTQAGQVLVCTVTARNATTAARDTHVWLQFMPDEVLSIGPAGLVIASGRVHRAAFSPDQAQVNAYETPLLRAVVEISPTSEAKPVVLGVATLPGDTGAAGSPNCVLASARLEPGAALVVQVKVPFAGNDVAEEWVRVREMDIAAARQSVDEYWEQIARAPASIDCPPAEATLGDFVRAVPTHILMNAFKDTDTGHIVLPAGTLHYGSCGNEAIWQVEALDALGHHDRARAILESLLATQGIIKPDGRFTSAAGALQASDFDQGQAKPNMFSYNLDHGVILRGLVAHYEITGDSEWLSSIARNLVAACEFVVRERASTAGDAAEVQGLLPPGHLEDNPEWRYWFAVNAYAYAGVRAVAAALGDIGHDDAARTAAEADRYRADILRAMEAARVASPVVRLGNGRAVPHIPARQQLRGREMGWFREAGYGPLHLWAGGVLDDHAREVTWVLQDLEDNLFTSPEFGFAIDRDRDWFSLGGVASQPNLLPNGMAYLHRDQIAHAVRALYNNIRLSLYEDVRCMAEWASEPGLGAGPFYKPSDEARVVYWLRCHLVLEQGSTLWLGKGVPRSWSVDGQTYGVHSLPTTYGRVDYSVVSDLTATGAVRADVALDLRRLPGEVLFRFRHPTGAYPVEILIDGQPGEMSDPETVRVPAPELGTTRFHLTARYAP